MAQYASESIGQFRFTSLILTFIGTLALLLASVGIYGVMAHSISQRTHEIGVRLALGAMRSSIFGSVVGQGFVLASIGIVLGTIGGFFVGRSIRLRPTAPSAPPQRPHHLHHTTRTIRPKGPA